MRLILLGLGTVLFTCLLPTPTSAARGDCREIVQGNGSIITGDRRRERGKFHVLGEQRGDRVSGRLDYRDRENNNMRIRSRDLVALEIIDDETRQLTFSLSDDPEHVAIVTLRDAGKHGRADFFEISVGDYFASGNLRNGNVRLKQKNGGCGGVVPEDGGVISDDESLP